MAAPEMTTRPSASHCDLIIPGSGSAGLTTAGYATSEGPPTMVPKPEILGLQAGTSSLILHALGFQHGTSAESGEDLGIRALEQA